MWEVVLILVVALIFLGPQQLAETARVVGKMYRELQKMMWDIRSSVDLDSLTSMNSRNEPDQKQHDTAQRMIGQGDLVPPPGEKTGPDFYAELLEKSAEEEKKAESLDSAHTQMKEEEKIDTDIKPRAAS